jgi:hypothetical protein
MRRQSRTTRVAPCRPRVSLRINPPRLTHKSRAHSHRAWPVFVDRTDAIDKGVGRVVNTRLTPPTAVGTRFEDTVA